MNSESALTSLENPADQRHLVTFRLDQQIYALPIEPISRILEMVAITPIPQIQRPVAGVINVQGAAVPVVDMRQHFGLPEAPWQLDTHIILSRINEWVVGLIVDEVIDVLDLPADQITSPADILPEELGEAPLLQGLAHIPDGMVLVLDLAHLFRPSQTRALAQAAAALPELMEEVPEEPPAAPESREPDAKPAAAPPQPEATAAKDTAAKQKAPETAPAQPVRTQRKKRSPRKVQSEAAVAKDAAIAEKAPETAPAQPARTRRKRRSSRKAQDVTAAKDEESAKEAAEAASPPPARPRRKRRAPRKAPDAAAAKDADTAPEAKALPDQEAGESKA